MKLYKTWTEHEGKQINVRFLLSDIPVEEWTHAQVVYFLRNRNYQNISVHEAWNSDRSLNVAMQFISKENLADIA